MKNNNMLDNSVKINNLSFKYNGSDKNIFNNINMDVPGGEFVCFLGKSGCGKSTLLRLISGLEKPSKGEIYFGDQPNKRPGLDKGVVFQDYGLYPWMTAGKNIELAIEQKYPKISKSEKREQAKEIIRKVGLKEEVYKMLPKELSGGMRQRCAIARSFAIDPPVLLMDEPFGALDAVTRATLQDMVLDLWVKGEPKKTVFFVTHDVDEALLLAERIFVLGQSGSDVILDVHVSDDERLLRDENDREKTNALRNKLVHTINQDVKSRL